MKIAYTIGSINRGGSETLLMDLIQSINKNDFILVYRKKGDFESLLSSSNILCYLVPGKNILRHIYHLRKLLIKNSIDIVHAQQPLDAFFSFFANLGTKRKSILSVHGYDFNDSVIYKFFLFITLHLTKQNVFVSETQKNYYVNKYKLNVSKQSVVYNGVNFKKIKYKDASENNLKIELNCFPQTILLGTVGNFVRVRDHFFLCNFLKLLNEKLINFHFIFIGKQSNENPELYENCVKFCSENNISNKVSFLGGRNDVPEILKDLDAFVYSSKSDTFGIAVVEAIATGIPVFVNDMDTMLEITDHGKLANIYKSNDVNDLFAIFEKYLSEIDDFNQKAFKNAELVRIKYSIQNHIANLNQVYNSL